MSFLLSALGIIIVFGLVIFLHEFGHFIVAKKSGVRVERFSFGLGPEAVGFQWGETRYCIAWIPLGGEVRMAGDTDYDESAGDGAARPRDPGDFYAQPWYRRAAVVLAGPAMNYVLAFLLFALVAFAWGEPEPSQQPVVGDLVQGYPAQAAGLRPGDRVLSVGGVPTGTWREAAETIHQHPEESLVMEVEREGERLSVRLTPRRDPSSGMGLVGIAPQTVYHKVGFFQAILRGGQQTVGWSFYTLRYLGEKIVKREKPELSGPLGIASVIAKATRSGAQDFLYLMAMISVGIGLFNLFPIPLLDGGHLMFYLWEGITRRPVTRNVMRTANAAGLSLLLVILLFATYSDIRRMRSHPAADVDDAKSAPAEPAKP